MFFLLLVKNVVFSCLTQLKVKISRKTHLFPSFNSFGSHLVYKILQFLRELSVSHTNVIALFTSGVSMEEEPEKKDEQGNLHVKEPICLKIN